MNLSDWRRRIDEIDKKLVELLNARSQCALEIGKLKQAAKIPLYQPDREKEVLAHVRGFETRGRFDTGFVHRGSTAFSYFAWLGASCEIPLRSSRVVCHRYRGLRR